MCQLRELRCSRCQAAVCYHRPVRYVSVIRSVWRLPVTRWRQPLHAHRTLLWLTSAHSQTHSLTAGINTTGLLTTRTMGRHAVIHWQMMDYCSRLSSKQRLLLTLNTLAAYFSFRFWLFRFHFIIVLDIFVTVSFPFLLTFSFPFPLTYITLVYKGGRCKQCAIILYEDRVIPIEISTGCNAKFCNFWMVAIATEIVRG